MVNLIWFSISFFSSGIGFIDPLEEGEGVGVCVCGGGGGKGLD